MKTHYVFVSGSLLLTACGAAPDIEGISAGGREATQSNQVVAELGTSPETTSEAKQPLVACSTYLAPFVNHGICEAVVLSITSNEAYSSTRDRVASSATEFILRKNGTWLTNAGVSYGRPGKWLFSDRYSGTYPNQQPYTITSSDTINAYIAADGSLMYIHHPGWSWWVPIVPICDEGVMYGFGSPIGGISTRALYVFSIKKIDVPC